jgi:hypothetical protein
VADGLALIVDDGDALAEVDGLVLMDGGRLGLGLNDALGVTEMLGVMVGATLGVGETLAKSAASVGYHDGNRVISQTLQNADSRMIVFLLKFCNRPKKGRGRGVSLVLCICGFDRSSSSLLTESEEDYPGCVFQPGLAAG